MNLSSSTTMMTLGSQQLQQQHQRKRRRRRQRPQSLRTRIRTLSPPSLLLLLLLIVSLLTTTTYGQQQQQQQQVETQVEIPVDDDKAFDDDDGIADLLPPPPPPSDDDETSQGGIDPNYDDDNLAVATIPPTLEVLLDDDSLQEDFTSLSYRQAIDFRDLFLTPEESMELGGSGQQPYGNMFADFVWPVISEMTDPSTSMINAFVTEFTTEQSGIAGTLHYNTTLVELGPFDISGTYLTIVASNLRVDGLETLHVTELLKPTTHPHVLRSTFTIEDLVMTVRLRIVLDGPTALQSFDNTVDITVRIPEATFTLDAWILLEAYSLLKFPVNNLLEIPCWLGLFPDTSGQSHNAVEIQQFTADLSAGIALTVECVDCSPLMETFVPQLLGTIQDSFDQQDTTNVVAATDSASTTKTITNTITATPDSIATQRVEQLIEDAVYNAYNLLDLSTATQEAALLCPHHPEYNETYANDPNNPHSNATFGLDFETYVADIIEDSLQQDANVTSLLELSKDSFEAVFAAGFVGVQTVGVLVAQRYIEVHQNVTAELESVALAEEVWYPDEPANYLNWTNLTDQEALLRLALRAVQDVQPSLANNLLRDNLLVNATEGTNVLIVPLNLVVDSTLGHVIEVYQVVVYGLDSITDISLLTPLNSFELRSEVTWEQVGVVAYLNISSPTNQYQEETMTLSMEVYGLAVTVDILLPIDLETLGEIPIGGILQNELQCLVTVVQNASLTNLDISVDEISPPRVDGYLDPALKRLVNTIGRNMLQDYGRIYREAVPIFFQTTVKSLLNTIFYDLVNFDANCDVVVPQPPGFMDFQDLLLEDEPYGSLMSKAYLWLNATFFNQEGVNTLNELIGTTTNEQSNTSGVLAFLTDFGATFETQIVIGNWQATAGGSVENITVRNLDSLGLPFRLIWPSEPWVMDSNITMGVNDYETNASQPLTVSADILIWAEDGIEMDIHNELSVSLGLIEMKLGISLLLKLLELSFMYFPLKAAGNLECWTLLLPPRRNRELLEDSNLPGASGDIFFDYYNATFDFICKECSSPLLPDMIERLYRIGENSSELIEELIVRVVEGEALQVAINDFVQNSQANCLAAPEIYKVDPRCVEKEDLENTTLPPGAETNLTTFSEEYSNFTADLEESLAILNATNTSINDYCPEHVHAWKEPPPPSQTETTVRDINATFFSIGFALFSFFIFLCFVVARIVVYYKNKWWMESLPPQGAKFLKYIQDKETERDEYLDETMTSLFHSPFLPPAIRLAVPFIIVVNMGFFAVTHLATSIIISVEVNFGGQYFMIHNLFAFNFKDGLVNTYANGGYEMAILLLIFGGVWPYFRCILSLILWFTPPHYLNSSTRGRIFLWIDAMNKLTVRDIFKFLVIIAIFFIYVGGPYVFNQGDGELYSLTILGWPAAGLYCGMIAMIISRVSSRWLLAQHYKAMDGAREAYHKDKVGEMIEESSKSFVSFSDSDSCSDSGSSYSITEKPTTKKALLVEPVEQAKQMKKLEEIHNPKLQQQQLPVTKTVPVVVSSSRAAEVSEAEREEDSLEDEEETAEESDEDEEEDGEVDDILNEGQRTITICGREFLLGNVAVAFALITVLLLLIVALVYIPAVSIDLSAILELFLESGTTYEQAISQFGVYAFICAAVLKCRLAVESVSDYVAVVILLVLGIGLISFTWVLDFKRWCNDVITNGWRRMYPALLEKDEYKKKERNLVMMPTYLRLRATKYSTCYVLAYVLGIYQLGAVTIYAIHYFCTILDEVYGALAFIGLITTTDGQCWEAQMKQYHNVIVLIGCFLYLSFMFGEQLFLQRKANVAQARQFLQELQEQRFWEDQIANSKAEYEKDDAPRRQAAVGILQPNGPYTTSMTTDSEMLSNLEQSSSRRVGMDDSSSKVNSDHDVDGQFFGDSRYSFADPRYSFNNAAGAAHGDLSDSELLTTITESDNVGTEDSTAQGDDYYDHDHGHGDETDLLDEPEEDILPPPPSSSTVVSPATEEATSITAYVPTINSSDQLVDDDSAAMLGDTEVANEEEEEPIEFDV